MAAVQVRVLLATRPVVVQHLTAFFMEENMRAVGLMGHAGVGGLSRVQPAKQQEEEHPQAKRGSDEPTPALQSLMRLSSSGFCFSTKQHHPHINNTHHTPTHKVLPLN